MGADGVDGGGGGDGGDGSQTRFTIEGLGPEILYQ